jgi:4-carboxymuconolactone decarboxylase
MSNGDGTRTAREVMLVEGRWPTTPLGVAMRDFVFGDLWARPGLSRRDRRWVTLTCVGIAGAAGPIDAHVYAALASDDIDIEEMLEFVLHFAVYCGWPKASHLEGVVVRQWARVQQERGLAVEPRPPIPSATLGPNDWDKRLAGGAEEFAEVNLQPAPTPDTPYRHAGILNFVFGHVWRRPGLTRRERRIISLVSVASAGAATPIRSHVTSALHSGDITKEEMDEIVLHFAVYHGFPKATAVSEVVETAWAERPAPA